MGSKLKRKKASVRNLAPFSNRQAQHMSLEFHASHAQLKKMEEEIWKDAFDEGEQWSNIVNTVTFMMALADVHKYGARRMLKLVKKANEYVGMANSGEMTIMEMINYLHDKKKFGIDEKYVELVRKYGL